MQQQQDVQWSSSTKPGQFKWPPQRPQQAPQAQAPYAQSIAAPWPAQQPPFSPEFVQPSAVQQQAFSLPVEWSPLPTQAPPVQGSPLLPSVPSQPAQWSPASPHTSPSPVPWPGPQAQVAPQWQPTQQDLQQPSLQAQQGLRKKLRKQRSPRSKRIRRWVLVSTLLLTIIAVIFFSQANSAAGAQTADIMRAVLGPQITAQVESWFLGVSDTAHQVQYHLGNQHVDAPWALPDKPPPPPHIVSPTLMPMSLTRITPTISPALPGEGIWATQSYTGPPTNFPFVAKAFIRPDQARPYAIVTMLQFDTRFVRLHMVAGTIEPGGPRHVYGPGVIPASDQKGNVLLAAFNGGFKYADGQYGMMVNGTIYIPPVPGSATIAITKEGQIILGVWGVDPYLNSSNTDLFAWRQNASLLIDDGKINPLTQDGAAWGGTILNRAYTWRSAIGITAQGTLIYAAGGFLTALTLGEALHAAGAVMAMQTDINPFWVRAFLYSRSANGALQITKLNPGMQGNGTEYLYGNQRDFFYLTRFQPPKPKS